MLRSFGTEDLKRGTTMERTWIDIEQNETPCVRVVQFNVLADCLTKNAGFVPAPLSLAWQDRWPRLEAMITDVRADIVSLVEVDHHYFADCWLNRMQCLGFECVGYARRSSSATHGVALFVRTNRFRVRAKLHLEDTVAAIVARLCDRQTNRLWVVTSTHLKASAEAHETRTAQAALIERHARGLVEHGCTRLVLGDLNTHSATEPCLAAICSEPLAGADAMPWTTWKRRDCAWRQNKEEERGVEDYIMHSMNARCARLLGPPSDEAVRANGLLPGAAYVSDHLMLVADLYSPIASAAANDVASAVP